MKRILAIIAVAGFLAACSSTPDSEQAPAPVDEGKSGAPTGTTAPVTRQPIETTPIGGDPNKDPRLTDPKNILSKRSIYFDFDSDAIKAEFVPIVEAHGAFLRQYPGAKMLIQGNADDRGSREYNLALGQRRADALKKRLVLLGAKDSQVESVSLGEEKPVCTDQSEECWAKQRRDDMLYGGQF
ncbi:MAG: peptidoglycan-associated lipoprotein Pal [Burkholderiales bacterium]